MIKYFFLRTYFPVLWSLFLLLSLFPVLMGCQGQALPIGGTEQLGLNELAPAPAHEPERIAQKETVILTALGDILMHNTLIWSGGRPDGSYAFNFFEAVGELMEEGDYCTTNLETALAGSEEGYTGYPLFNSPDAIADHLKDYGVDGVITANNHILDRGYQGAVRTVGVLEKAGLDVLGVRKSPEDSGYLIKDIRGVKVGYLAYTYGTNGLNLPSEHQYFINMLEKEQILQDIRQLRTQADLLILVLHWGVEYSTEPTNEQRTLAREFLTAGADAIIGSHPHVIQPVEYFNIDGKEKFAAYSIGNFIGDQRGLERNSGVILQLKFNIEKVIQPGKPESSASEETADTLISQTATLKGVELIPTYSHSYAKGGRQQFRVVPIEKTIEKIKADEEEVFSHGDLPLLENVLKTTEERLNQLILKDK